MIKERGSSLIKEKTIIVVEDDESNREMFELIIASETPYYPLGFQGSDELLQSIDEIKALKPALFLLDYHLPPLTGFDLYDYLQAIDALNGVPTVIVTADSAQEVEDAITQRHLTLLSKPFEMDHLFAAINQAVG
jgi:CheY-like chemotaxis protein